MTFVETHYLDEVYDHHPKLDSLIGQVVTEVYDDGFETEGGGSVVAVEYGGEPFTVVYSPNGGVITDVRADHDQGLLIVEPIMAFGINPDRDTNDGYGLELDIT